MLHDGLVHGMLFVEKNVVDLLRDGILPQPYQFLHALSVIGLATKLLKDLFSENHIVVDHNVVVVVDDVCGLIANRSWDEAFGRRGNIGRGRRTLDVSHVLSTTMVCFESL
jgi:hypothetical protein